MRTCPTCGKPVVWQDNPDRPFCSERCRLIDFGHWVDEDYRVPTRAGADEIEYAPHEESSDTSGDAQRE